MSYKLKDIKSLAFHLKTMGAYVQAPNPNVVGLGNYQVVGSQDAKSLYPTIMSLLNIGYDTLQGRLYEEDIVSNLIDQLINARNIIKDKPEMVQSISQSFKASLGTSVKKYMKLNDVDNKKNVLEFSTTFYGECFRKLLIYEGDTNNIFTPINDTSYYLLKSCLYPILETYQWISPKNKGYSTTIIDHVFYNPSFEDKYKHKKFYILDKINSSKTQLKILSYNEFISTIANKYILNPYGTYFDKHDDNKSFEVDLIFGGMDDRGFVKNQFLILDAIIENWGKLSQVQQAAFVLDDEHIDEKIAEEVIKLVGSSDPRKQEWELKNLKSIVFNTILNEEKLAKALSLLSSQKVSKSNSIKVTLNSGYGIYGMATWNYGNNLIANSITSGGKIYGIKLFQQIAVNRLTLENEKIESGYYKE